MCVDATDPEKGNWLRYINWARSGKEQNLFPLEINRTIYYKSLKVSLPEHLLAFIIDSFYSALLENFFLLLFISSNFIALYITIIYSIYITFYETLETLQMLHILG